MMHAEPTREHRWLHKMIGEWTSQAEAVMEPGKPAEVCHGTESVRSLGGLWVLSEGHGEMPGGGPATMMMTLGYDPLRQRFVGTWVGSMMTNLWVYEGLLDADERVLTLEAEGPDMEGQSKTVKYRDVIEFESDDHRVLTSHARGDDGVWR